MPSRLAQALARGDRAEIGALLADSVTFHSPVRSYDGRDQVVHLLATISEVVDEFTPVRAIEQDGERATVLAGRVGEHALDAVLLETVDDAGAVTELTLMLRPLKPMLAAIERMGQALGAG